MEKLARHQSVNPTEIVYSITMETVLSAIVKRMGDNALSLTVEETELTRRRDKAAIDNNLDIRDYLEEGINAKLITCTPQKTLMLWSSLATFTTIILLLGNTKSYNINQL